MRRVQILCLAAVLLTAGFAVANTVWNPAFNPDPNAIVDGKANWNVAANWTLGLPGLGTEIPPLDPKAVLNVANAAECIVDSAVSCQTLSMGDNGTTTGNFLRVVDGGSLILVKNDWNAIGYTRASTMTVEAGGYVEFGRHVLLGRDGDAGTGAVGAYPSYLILDGGTVVVKDVLNVGNNDADKVDGGGIVKANSGLLDIRNNLSMMNQAVSRVDIRFGTIIINGDRRTNLTNWTQGIGTPGGVKIVTGFGGAGTVIFDYNVTNPGKTTVKAIHPMNPTPAYGSMVAVPIGLTAPVNLSWINMDPNDPGDPVYVDVWFGTDPNKLNPLTYTKVVSAQNQTTVQVNAPAVGGITKYYWQVDSYIYGSPTGTPIAGDVFEFSSNDDTPPTVVIETSDMITWANQPVQLNATITDAGTSPVTITWSSNPAGAVFSPSANVEDPAVSANPATFPTNYTLTCSVKDAFNLQTNSDTMVLSVAADACAAAGIAGVAAGYPMNIAGGDCVVDISDLAALVADWLADYALTAPAVIP